jgi:amidophosphoribosyltransferase
VKNHDVVLIDDSIVRGTTMRQIIGLLRKAGARSVHVRISCPPVLFPCFMGIDFPTRQELIAGQKDMAHDVDFVESVRKEIKADTLGYQTVDGLVDSIGLPDDQICLACLNGDYPLRSNPLENGNCNVFTTGRD